MDVAAFTVIMALATAAATRQESRTLFLVNQDNEPIEKCEPRTDPNLPWYRTAHILIMHDPPDMFYEPKEWSHATVLLLKRKDKDEIVKLCLPSGILRKGESHVDCAVRVLYDCTAIDVLQPENCVQHLFTFPYDSGDVRHWSNFMECVFRGVIEGLEDHGQVFHRMSLEELKNKIIYDEDAFCKETYCAIRLYFQRQLDLRAKRRLLKGYSFRDLETYGFRTEKKIVFRDDETHSQRNDALDYTMTTDDGMSPRLLKLADVVLLGVSRAGKTPLSLLLSKTKGLKVANIPIVLEVPPPIQLSQIDPKRVFCITQQADHLVLVRESRLRREFKQRVGPRSTYADLSYVQRDLENSKDLAREHGYTIIDITDRAMEEAASLIMSKLKERFPESDFGESSI